MRSVCYAPYAGSDGLVKGSVPSAVPGPLFDVIWPSGERMNSPCTRRRAAGQQGRAYRLYRNQVSVRLSQRPPPLPIPVSFCWVRGIRDRAHGSDTTASRIGSGDYHPMAAFASTPDVSSRTHAINARLIASAHLDRYRPASQLIGRHRNQRWLLRLITIAPDALDTALQGPTHRPLSRSAGEGPAAMQTSIAVGAP
jgi:hypothetical protein